MSIETRQGLLLHICQPEDWQSALQSGGYAPASIQSEGFIHCSTPDQLLEVANHFYHPIPGLIVLWISPPLVQPEIRWEAVGDALFPHIYGVLNLEAVIKVSRLILAQDGSGYALF